MMGVIIQPKPQFLGNINKFDKTLGRLKKEKNKEKNFNTKNKRGQSHHLTSMKMMTMQHCKQLLANIFDNVNERYYVFSKLAKEDINYLNICFRRLKSLLTEGSNNTSLIQCYTIEEQKLTPNSLGSRNTHNTKISQVH